MKHLVASMVLGTMILAAQPVMAADTGKDFKEMSHEERKAHWESLSEKERSELKEKKRAEWEAMSDKEKLKIIEEKRTERMAEMEKKWNSMSDAEKIKFAEERFKHKGKHGKDCGGKYGKKD